MLGSYQEYVFIMILQGVWLFFFCIGYEMDSEIRALWMNCNEMGM